MHIIIIIILHFPSIPANAIRIQEEIKFKLLEDLLIN